MYMHVQRFELRDPNCICSLLLTCRRMPHLKSQWRHTFALRLNLSAPAIRICCSLKAQLLWMLSQGHRPPAESRRGCSLRNSRKESFDGQPLAHWCQSKQQTSWCQVRIYWKWNLIDGYVNSIRTAWWERPRWRRVGRTYSWSLCIFLSVTLPVWLLTFRPVCSTNSGDSFSLVERVMPGRKPTGEAVCKARSKASQCSAGEVRPNSNSQKKNNQFLPLKTLTNDISNVNMLRYFIRFHYISI